MLETLDASGLVAHAIGPGDRFYIALRKVRLIRQFQSGDGSRRASTPPIIRDNPSAPQANGKLEKPQRLTSPVVGRHDRGTQADLWGLNIHFSTILGSFLDFFEVSGLHEMWKVEEEPKFECEHLSSLHSEQPA